MCNDKIHLKIKNAKDHTIVDIIQVGVSGGKGNLDFSNIKCKLHTLQLCCIFCSNCDELACPSCITKGHAGHTFIEIKEAYNMKVEWLKNRKGKLVMNRKNLDAGQRKLNQITEKENSNCQKTIQDIQNQREALKREVDKYALKHIEEVNQNMTSIQDSISQEKKKVLISRQKAENNLKTAEEMFTTIDMSFFFQNADILKSLDDERERVNVIHKSVPNFKPGSILQSNVGTLYYDVSSSNTGIDMKVNNEFTTGLKHCQYISACSDGSLWIDDGLAKLLHKVKLEGNILTTVLTINTELRGIAVTHNDLLIADATSKLKFVDGNTGKLSDSKYKVEPLAIISVHITCDNKVIVGAMIPGKAFPVTGRRVVIEMDQEGNHLTVYEQDKHKHNIFSYPRSITSTSNGNIFVGDRISSDKRGRVLVLGKDGDILNEYTGCHDIYHKYKSLRIANITTTPSDNIVVFDLYHHLHILDSSANPKYYYDIRDIGIKYSYCLVFTCPTTFYLGCSPPTSSTTNSKVYEIQCSGF